ncbi:MAG: ABC transporter substrate-binding protein [Candidatus Bathyarchaeia archaeon]
MFLKIAALAVAVVVVVAVAASLTTVQTPSPSEVSAPVVDDWGRAVDVGKPPERIVSLLPSTTEILFAVGVGDRVVGVDRYSDFPPQVAEGIRDGRITVVGGIADPSIETVIALEPDLVLAGHKGIQDEVVNALESRGLTVVALDPSNVTQLYDSILLVGKVTGNMQQAEFVVSNMKEKVQSITGKTAGLPKVRVYYEVWNDPLMTVGPGTWIHDLIGIAGGENIFADSSAAYPQISSEAVVELNPDVIILPTQHPMSLDDVGKRPAWSMVNAVKNGKVYTIDGDIISRPGPRIVEGLEQLARLIHPDAF